MKTAVETVELEPTKIERPNGRRGYRWAPAVYIIKQDGSRLFPPMLRREARRYCKQNGWVVK